MSFTNINDPAGIKALLEQLRSSQAWQETVSANPSQSEPEQPAPAQAPVPSPPAEERQPESAEVADAAPSTSVASLLSQLRSSEWASIPNNTPSSSQARSALTASRQISQPPQITSPFQPDQRPPRPASGGTPSSTRAQDVRSMSFQQALPLLTQLAGNPEFVASVARLQEEQKDLERQLWEERSTIHRKHEEKVKVARTKASLIGAGLSKHEADMMNDAYRRDLQRFDAERVLLAWDALTQKQQAALETLGVPTMFPTGSQANCEAKATEGGTGFRGDYRVNSTATHE
ncbi:hypothetical protein HYDPIDRAFT_23513 [Hydnomerulius pinastri MD-312]|nr:hypothetical protein HYDPIDRAFT_23513 [Hydnomerulius pinastri MD-312]